MRMISFEISFILYDEIKIRIVLINVRIVRINEILSSINRLSEIIILENLVIKVNIIKEVVIFKFVNDFFNWIKINEGRAIFNRCKNIYINRIRWVVRVRYRYY